MLKHSCDNVVALKAMTVYSFFSFIDDMQNSIQLQPCFYLNLFQLGKNTFFQGDGIHYLCSGYVQNDFSMLHGN